MPGAGKTHILSALAAQIIQSGALGDDQEVLNYTLIICKGVLMNLTKILTRFLFVFSSIIVFELGFYGNQWGAVMDDLQYRRNVNLDKIVADLVERTGGESEQLLVIQGQATTWNDGSLGCPLPGVTYTQALVDGYWIVLEVEGTNYDYRAAESGFFFLCENDFPPALPPGTPNS